MFEKHDLVLTADLTGTLTGTLAALATGLAAAGTLRIVKLVIVALLSERIFGALERRHNGVLRVPLGVQECLGLLSGTKDHIVRNVCRTRGVAKAATTVSTAAAGLATAVTATTYTAVLTYKRRELRERGIQLANIRSGVHSAREELTELARVIGHTAVLFACIASHTVLSGRAATTRLAILAPLTGSTAASAA
jgi:hypothetical protein